jgi:hypothetical protein
MLNRRRWLSFGMLLQVAWCKFTDVSEKLGDYRDGEGSKDLCNGGNFYHTKRSTGKTATLMLNP